MVPQVMFTVRVQMLPLIVFLLVCSGVRQTLAGGCPFHQALDNGHLSASLVDQQKNQLVNEKYLLSPGQPAFLIWNTHSLDSDVVDLFNRSTSLLLAKQFYVQQQFFAATPPNLTTAANIRDLLRSATDCVPEINRCNANPVCDPKYKYSLPGGQCNNLHNPKWGSARTAYQRLLPPVFDDAIFTIRKSVSNSPLQSTRTIGNTVNQFNAFNPAPKFVPNYGSLLIGQYITHDVGLRDSFQNNNGGAGLSCCSRDQSHMLSATHTYLGCEAIEIPENDPFYQKFGNKRCMSFVRSQPILSNDCSMDTTEISNSVSHFVDQSNIYGSDNATEHSVRSHVGGRLLISNGVAALHPNCVGAFCYFTGDSRAMFNPTLGLWHSVFIRFHNYIANRLAASTRLHSDESLFQETRRIVKAVYQNIVFNEWLPLYVGTNVAERRGVSCPTGGHCRGRYNPKTDPSNLNEFAVGAFRMYHSNIPLNMNMYDKYWDLTVSKKLSESFQGSNILETHYADVMRGLLKDPIWAGKYPDNIRNEVFNNFNPDGIGLDLLAVDTQRGRDHGLNPYHVYLELSMNGTLVVREWNDLAIVFAVQTIEKLQQMYESVFDIDLLVGLLLEQKSDIYTGPVGQYIVEEQFYRFKYGDRFFYSLENNPRPFSDHQINEINRQKFANVLCAVGELDEVFARSMEVESSGNPRVRCDSFKAIDLLSL